MSSDQVQLTQYEIQLDTGDLTIRFRTMEIRFYLHRNASFEHIRGQLFLKCIADIASVPNVKRQTSELVYIRSDEKMSNLRLINSAAACLS